MATTPGLQESASVSARLQRGAGGLGWVRSLVGTLTAGRDDFKPWRTIGGEELAPAFLTELQVLIEGVFEPRRFLDLIRDFIVFDDDGGTVVKRVAGYHQFHAVRAAVRETLRAAKPGVAKPAPVARMEPAAADFEGRGGYEAGRGAGGGTGDRRIGIVWHTPGTGKSLTMAFYAGASSASRQWRTRPSWY